MAAAAIFIVLTLNTKIIINYVDIKYKKSDSSSDESADNIAQKIPVQYLLLHFI